jgi:hypothetical protein
MKLWTVGWLHPGAGTLFRCRKHLRPDGSPSGWSGLKPRRRSFTCFWMKLKGIWRSSFVRVSTLTVTIYSGYRQTASAFNNERELLFLDGVISTVHSVVDHTLSSFANSLLLISWWMYRVCIWTHLVVEWLSLTWPANNSSLLQKNDQNYSQIS